MIRSMLTGLLGLFSVVAVASLPIACQSGGVGDPCTPEDEYDPSFSGFKVTEENIESRSFQCATRICLVNHFQGRVSCPLGQPGVGDGERKSCNGPKDKASCGADEECVESETMAPDCDPDQKGGCPAGTACDKNRKICVCTQAVGNFFCSADKTLKSYVCHKKGNCQIADGDDKANRDANGNLKDCCIPGTDTPVAVPVCGQCDAKSKRDAAQAVYCSCRCGVAEGEADDPDFNFCECPTGFTCSEIRKNVGLGDKQITGKYCIKEGSEFNGEAQSCGEVKGHFDGTCRGLAAGGF